MTGHDARTFASVCDACGKRTYPDRKTARAAAKAIPPCGPRPRAYECLHWPGRWHVGHLPDEVRRGDVDRAEYRESLGGDR